MSRRGSRTSRRSICSIPRARAPSPRPRPIAGRRASRSARSTACLSPSRTISPPRTSRCRSAPPASSRCRRRRTRRRPRGCAKPAPSSSPRPRCRITACCRRGFRASIPSPAIPGTSARTPADPLPAPAPPAAAGYGPLHLGTDIGGSVRLPACWCGLVALKPSLGRVPVDPFYVGRVAGPMTRTVDDAALMMSVLSRPDRRDGMSLPAHEINWKALDKSPRKAAHRVDARCRHRPAAGEGSARGRRQGRQGVRIRRRRRHRSRRHIDARDARRDRQFLSRAKLGRSFQADAGGARQDAALYPSMGGGRREALGP